MKLSSKLMKLLIVLFTFILFFNISSYASHDEDGEEVKRVLLISSYSPSFQTFFQQVDGIKSQFEDKNIEFDIEFMDTKRLYTEENIHNFYVSLKYKLGKLNKYDTIIVSDDNALVFVMKNKDELFNEIPIVFLGINNIENAINYSKDPYVTGFIENISIEETIKSAKMLNPDSTRVVAISDNTPSGKADLKSFYLEKSNFPNLLFDSIDLSKINFVDFILELQKLDKNDIVILLSLYRDSEDNSVSFSEGLNIIISNTETPIYHLYYHGLGDGIIGGKVVSHYNQGLSAANVVNQVLSGIDISTIKYADESPNEYIFDYNIVKKFNLDIKHLPKNSIILNKPISFYEENKIVLLNITMLFIFMSIILAITSYLLIKSRNAEKNLSVSEERLELALEGASLGTWDWDISTDDIKANSRWFEMLGYVEDEFKLTKDLWIEMIHPDDKNQTLKLLDNHLIGIINSFENEIRLKHKNNEWIWVLSKGKVIEKDDSGIPIRACGTHLDISKRKNQESKILIQSKELSCANEELLMHKENLEDLINDRTTELHALIENLKSTQEQLIESEKMASLGGLVAGIAHEINTPVGTGVTLASHLKDKTKKIKSNFDDGILSKTDFQSFINMTLESSDMILTNMNRTADLVNSFKQVATDQSNLQLREFNIKEYIQEILRSLNARFKRTKYNIILNAPDNIVIYNYPGILYQILSNLLMNSLNHGFQDITEGDIIINISQENNRIILNYSDTGKGISEENIAKIYEPFYTTNRLEGNTGLGMNIVYNAVTQTLSGTIKCESRIGEGTSFLIIFPCDINTTNI